MLCSHLNHVGQRGQNDGVYPKQFSIQVRTTDTIIVGRFLCPTYRLHKGVLVAIYSFLTRVRDHASEK